MAVHIKLIKNNIKSSSSYGKYFAKAVSQGEVTLEDIAAEACRNSGFSEGSVVGVVTELQDILKQRLREGQTVVLPGIGRFSLRVESILSARRAPHPRPAYPLRPLRRSQGRLAERLQTLSSIRCFSASVRL